VRHATVRQILLILTLSLLLLSLSPGPSLHASTLLIEGEVDGLVTVSQEHRFTVPPGGVRELVFRYATPTMVWSASAHQRMGSYRVNFTPRPAMVDRQKDSFGNEFIEVTWRDLKGDATVNGHFDVKLHLTLKEMAGNAPFPLKGVPTGERLFLDPTPLVQSNDKSIVALAQRLTEGATGEQAAVTAILNWVVNNVRYGAATHGYDALSTLDARHGNSLNISHLSVALLRAVGIPARIVGGIVLGRPWKVPFKGGTLQQSRGEGSSTWFEIYYPDVGWMAYDARQSHLFVSPRYIKTTVGRDSHDTSASWRSGSVPLQLRERLTVNYRKDDSRVVVKEVRGRPNSYILTSGAILPVAVELEATGEGAEVPAPQEGGDTIEFGNMELPPLAKPPTAIEGSEATYQSFERETAERVDSKGSFAQAFRIGREMKLVKVSLGLRRFKVAAGTLSVDVVKDDSGRPGAEVVKSAPVKLGTVEYKAGYSWLPFTFSQSGDDGTLLAPGRYWIILRPSRDGIVNWFYTPTNPYGDADDTRSTFQDTVGGVKWSNLLNYDFTFKVSGRYR
jgi:hypothetical protein